ncbi:hypothetical protein DIS18_01800 [Algibacter marinivivus]|uniref:Uncharacterized protein n=1 Tax=Algibacter marinivivus TaxID=2100723 RepID=A0A2U2X6B6_9FLAO|nr:hypothetical protein DIS18_01800 [Algibacter marinivivus]
MFKQRKHRTFNYQPRFSKESQTDSSLDKKSDTKDFISKWRASKPRNRVGFPVKTSVLIFILVLLLICMYLLEKKYM